MRIGKAFKKLTIIVVAFAATTAAGVAVTGTPALAASVSACAANPTDANCTGAQVVRYDQCWNGSYVIAGGVVEYSDWGWTFRVTDRWSPKCQSNLAVVEVIAVSTLASPSYTFATKIRRGAGTLPYVMRQSAWKTYGRFDSSWPLVISPMVYAPANDSQACLSTTSNDQVVCTPYI